MATTLHLYPHMFSETERTLVEHGPLRVALFRYESGVAALRLRNERGEVIMLPFQGQQIWSAAFDGRDLTMQSMFSGPKPTQTYLENYGGFLLHCGFLSMGVPDPAAGDSHPLHGELPNAAYPSARLTLGQDEAGPFVTVSGRYQHTVAFIANYVAEPQVTLHGGSAQLRVRMAVTNLKRTPMHYLYMAHANFRPVDHGRLLYSAPSDPAHVRVRTKIPSHVKPTPDYLAFLEALQADPAQHEILRPDLAFDPEMVFYLDYVADEAGWAHTMQMRPDGSGDYIAHRPGQLDHGVRWICRTPDQDALGMVLPATAQPEGLAAETAKGHLKTLPGGETFIADMILGALTPEEAAAMADHIAEILGNAPSVERRPEPVEG